VSPKQPPPESAEIQVRVTPRSSRSRCEGGEPVRVWVTAPPVDGQANEAVVRTLAEALGVPRSRVRIVRGEASRDKTVRVDGLTAEEAIARLGPPSQPGLPGTGDTGS
jgi:uncharacterized protein (TIGR00251 family)